MIVLLLIWGLPLGLLPIIFDYNIPSNFWGIIYMVLPLIIHITLIIIYYKKSYPLFALPLGHFLFPLFLFAIMLLTTRLGLTPTSGDWALSIMGASFIYFIPFSLITLIISLVINSRK